MKYTRYNLKPKRKKSNNPLFYLAIVLLLALLFATVIVTILKKSGNPLFEDFFNISLPNTDSVSDENKGNGDNENGQDLAEGKDQEGTTNENGESVEATNINGEYYLLQCGAFKVKENAEKTISTLKIVGAPFILQDGELYKVYSGIYPSDKVDSAADSLKGASIESSKVTVSIGVSDSATTQLCKCIDGLLQITNKVTENTVVSVDTKELKTWSSELEKLEGDTDIIKDTNSIKEYINNLPEKIEKSGVEDILSTIGKIIIKYKK